MACASDTILNLKAAYKAKLSKAKLFFASIICLAVLPTLSACVPLILTAATATVVDVALDRRTPGTYYDDNSLERKLRNDISSDPSLVGINVSVTVFNGIVLLTGQAVNSQLRQQVGEITDRYKQTGQVRNVINELELSGKTNASSRLNDAWITAKVKARLLNAPGVPSNTVKVVTEHGKVYLLGQVTEAESEAAVGTINRINGVTHIVKVFEYIE